MSAKPAGAANSVDDYELWRLWKTAFLSVEKSVVAAATSASGVSDAEIAVLIRLDAAGGAMRQADLARELDWDRTRLSHQLTRMASRDLITRGEHPKGVLVTLTPYGAERLGEAKPAHIAEVERRLVAPLGPDGSRELAVLLRRIVDANAQS